MVTIKATLFPDCREELGIATFALKISFAQHGWTFFCRVDDWCFRPIMEKNADVRPTITSERERGIRLISVADVLADYVTLVIGRSYGTAREKLYAKVSATSAMDGTPAKSRFGNQSSITVVNDIVVEKSNDVSETNCANDDNIEDEAGADES